MRYLETAVVALAELEPFPGNARRGDVPAIAASLAELDQYRSLVVRQVDGRRVVLAGNHTLQALAQLARESARCELIDCTDAEARKINLVDNRSAELGGYDDTSLEALLAALDGDYAGTGWTAEDHALLLGRAGNADPGLPRPTLADRFLIPPFDVLDARKGWWQDRKRQWLALGIRSELGREVHDTMSSPELHGPKYQGLKLSPQTRDPGHYARQRRGGNSGPADAPYNSGTSVFDPVLCELAYRWFCPPGGLVIDPFAGGSVRGIVAAILGRAYRGCDLSAEQVAANEEQAAVILKPPDDSPVMVRVSAAQARQRFHGCEAGYIRDVCHGACCRSPAQPGGILVVVHPSEQAAVEAAGARVVDGRIQPADGRCPYQQPGSELCGVHETPAKPFGCIASPFTLNQKNTLIVRNRYRMLKCYKDDRDGPAPPAYQAFRASLNLIFGAEGAARLCAHLDGGGGDLTLPVAAGAYRMLRDNDAAKHGPVQAAPQQAARWEVGDAGGWELPAESADLLFTCPPYYDLEQYSDDPADLSSMTTAGFDEAYARILGRAAAALRPDRFAVIVTGDARDKAGALRDLRGVTIRAMESAGLALASGAVLVTAVGSLSVRAGGPFVATRKLGRTHQDVLVFCKGDQRKAALACGDVDVHMPEAEEAGD